MLSLIVNIVHLTLILFIVLTPFVGGLHALIIHIASTISILFHWSVNNDVCCLTLLENRLRGTDSGESFMHSIVSPVYKFAEDDVSKMSYIVLVLLGVISIYNLRKIINKQRKEGRNFTDLFFKKRFSIVKYNTN